MSTLLLLPVWYLCRALPANETPLARLLATHGAGAMATAVVAFCVPSTDNAASTNPMNSAPESPRKIEAGLKL